jgi:transcription elongation factor Elf1
MSLMGFNLNWWRRLFRINQPTTEKLWWHCLFCGEHVSDSTTIYKDKTGRVLAQFRCDHCESIGEWVFNVPAPYPMYLNGEPYGRFDTASF